MPIYIPLPVDRTPSKFADWLEITALLDNDANASLNDLKDILSGEIEAGEDQVSGDLTDDGPNQQIVQVSAEINRRIKASLKNYPFKFDGDKVVGPKKISFKSLPYVFCLLISYFGPKREEYHSKWKTGIVAKKFEYLSKASLEAFLENKKNVPSVKIFGYPRDWQGKTGYKKFTEALATICRESRQMTHTPRKNAKDAKDGGLDIIAWGNFPDKLPGCMLFAAQCGIGVGWEDKLNEVDDFFRWHVRDFPKFPKGVFIPHVPELFDEGKVEDWLRYTMTGGIIFNRCRIAFLVDTWVDQEVSDLCKEALVKIREKASLLQR